MNQINVSETRDIKLGDVVNSWGFVDCFGKKTVDRIGYVVRRINAVNWKDSPYYRIEAYNPSNEWELIEGAERFFEKAS